jgi:hypothetical protein
MPKLNKTFRASEQAWAKFKKYQELHKFKTETETIEDILLHLNQPQPQSDIPIENSTEQTGSGPRPMPSQNPIIKAYLRQKGIQDAKTEGVIQRAKAKEQLHQQFEAERLETEYKTWKKKQEEKQRRQPQRECGIDMGDSAGVPEDYIF